MSCLRAWIWPFLSAFIVCLLINPTKTLAQNDNWNDDWNQDNDPPARVARMNFTQGSVSFQPGGEGDWVDAVPNRPLTTGDNLWTDRNSRAELHVGSTSIRLGSETSLTFLELDDRVLQLRLAQGSTLVRVRHFDDDDTVEIDTPNLAFMVQRTGEYRIDVGPDGQTTIVDVYQGRGEAIGGGNNYTIVANQQASFSGDPDQGLNYDIDTLPQYDDFTRWVFDRDRREDNSVTANYVSPEMTGYEDLDDNGRWSYAGSYGPVWYPTNVPAGWAPYRFGHWAWVAPWGWTWVDDASWGFAPFHYGRWCQVGGNWAWVPGPVAVHPVYAPALVAFVGGGAGFHFSAFGGGVGVAWFPLGPGEVFVPGYHVSRAYVNQVNVTNTVVNVTKVTNVYNVYNTTNVTNVNVVNRVTYVNQNVAVTAVARDTFINARPVARNVVVVQQREIEQTPVARMTGVEPIRGSVMGAGKPTNLAPPRAVIARQVVAQHAPVQPPTPFTQRQDKLLVRPVAPVRQQPQVQSRPATMTQPEPARTEPVRTEPVRTEPTRAEPVRAEPIRTEPSRPQPARAEPVMNQPAPPVTRQQPTQVERPIQPAPRTEPAQPTRAPEPVNNFNRNNNGQERPQQNLQPNAQPSSQQSTQQSSQQGWSHPQARPAPPVQPKTETQARDEETKYKNWEAKPQPAKPQPEKPDAKKDDKKKNDNKK
jgi:hypothetical protein